MEAAIYRSADHPFTAWTSWEPARPAERLTESIIMSRSNSNSYLVTTTDGDLLINTGTAYQGQRHRERYEQLLGRPLNIRKIVLTQSHPDHVGGWSTFSVPGVETIAQERFPEGRLDRTRLRQFFFPRAQAIVGRKVGYDRPERRTAYWETPEPEVTTLFRQSHAFSLGSEKFELHSAPGGETLDGLLVWLPDQRTVFTGNLLGALFPQIPHLSTLRGDRPRSARLYIKSVDHLLSLAPERLVTGHHWPIEGAERIRFELTRLRDGAQYIHDRTVEGMNAGLDLWTLMGEITLPAQLQVGPNRGPLAWSVRAIWEEYAGWFRFESTTELYNVPPRAIWNELVELAGGPDVLARRAADHLGASRPLEALHFTDMALSADAHHRDARQVQISALLELIRRTGGDNFDELAYLESEVARARSMLT
jgi:glyoxylase-like metal-dependent hydrolase (beta-lactamase superfamily II)